MNKYDIALSAMNILSNYRQDLKHSTIVFTVKDWAGGFPVVFVEGSQAPAFTVRVSLSATDPSGSGITMSPNYALYIWQGMMSAEKAIENKSIANLSADVNIAKLAASAEAQSVLNSLT